MRFTRHLFSTSAALLCALSLSAGEAKPKAPKGETVKPAATPVERIRVMKDFKVELLYDVPKSTAPKSKEGSWVAMCVDNKGRLIVSDQYGPLTRVTPPPIGGNPDDIKLEKIPAAISDAQGLLWAFDSLYVCVNKVGRSGLYRITSSKNDDVLDKVEELRVLEGGGGEHGPHALVLSPDGKSIFVVCGNQTHLTELSGSKVPLRWSEDQLLPRMPDGNGFMAGVLAPGGNIYKVDPSGKNWELWCNGFRNPYDAAFNSAGDLITYDADMEWDMNTPWYRPTRICLAQSGAEFGWRNGTGKWPAYYADSLPPVLNIGPGCPTGVAFGYGAKFPAKYQNAFFACDWSYGKLYAITLAPEGATYSAAQKEEFLGASPLQLTDLVVRPQDGALYFTIGGRQTQSGLYRVTYTGAESTVPAVKDAPDAARDARHALEKFHGLQDPAAVAAAWPHLSSKDRSLRWAARIAIEHQPPVQWSARAVEEQNPNALMESLMALIRVSALDEFHRKPGEAPPDAALRAKIAAALERPDWTALDDDQRLELLRVHELLFTRFGPPGAEEAAKLTAKLDPNFPSERQDLNKLLCELLVYLQAPTAATKTLALMEKAPSQEEQLEYAKSLRMLTAGWTIPQRKEYMNWFLKAASYKGGNSFAKFVNNIKKEAVANLPAAAKADAGLMEVVNTVPKIKTPQEIFGAVLAGRGKVKDWTVEELFPKTEKALAGGRDFERGRRMFGACGCVACHRYNNEGGSVGPDLTAAAGRFNPHDLLESIILPSKEVSDQYANSIFVMTSGERITGRIINLHGDIYKVSPNMYDPNEMLDVSSNKVKSVTLSKTSPMPEELLNRLQEDEIMDLLAYLLSRGERGDKMFNKAK